MKRLMKTISAWAGVVLIFAAYQPTAAGQALSPPASINFDSLTATYHLSRDATNRSLLTTQEVILADFPGSGNFYGITRAIPRSYEGHSVDVKVLSVSDAAG